MKASEFIGLLFLARDVTHSVHLQTRSYAQHKALGEFYEAIPALVDRFAQASGFAGPVDLAKPEKATEIVLFLGQQLAIIESNRDTICAATNRPARNVIDAICERYLHTLHQLRFVA